jgi:hypothetical protein
MDVNCRQEISVFRSHRWCIRVSPSLDTLSLTVGWQDWDWVWLRRSVTVPALAFDSKKPHIFLNRDRIAWPPPYSSINVCAHRPFHWTFPAAAEVIGILRKWIMGPVCILPLRCLLMDRSCIAVFYQLFPGIDRKYRNVRDLTNLINEILSGSLRSWGILSISS